MIDESKMLEKISSGVLDPHCGYLRCPAKPVPHPPNMMSLSKGESCSLGHCFVFHKGALGIQILFGDPPSPVLFLGV